MSSLMTYQADHGLSAHLRMKQLSGVRLSICNASLDAAKGPGDAGLVAQQQCCGPLQLPVADVAVASQSHFGLTGAATSIGERPLMGLVNPAAMARMALGESLTNLMWAAATKLEHVKASVNWM